jgi:hypothetical protein
MLILIIISLKIYNDYLERKKRRKDIKNRL